VIGVTACDITVPFDSPRYSPSPPPPATTSRTCHHLRCPVTPASPRCVVHCCHHLQHVVVSPKLSITTPLSATPPHRPPAIHGSATSMSPPPPSPFYGQQEDETLTIGNLKLGPAHYPTPPPVAPSLPCHHAHPRPCLQCLIYRCGLAHDPG
jgi:hypothetical protein